MLPYVDSSWGDDADAHVVSSSSPALLNPLTNTELPFRHGWATLGPACSTRRICMVIDRSGCPDWLRLLPESTALKAFQATKYGHATEWWWMNALTVPDNEMRPCCV